MLLKPGSSGQNFGGGVKRGIGEARLKTVAFSAEKMT